MTPAVWDGHSCPSLLMLILILIYQNYLGTQEWDHKNESQRQRQTDRSVRPSRTLNLHGILEAENAPSRQKGHSVWPPQQSIMPAAINSGF
jgi:hypothetical protein